MRVLFVILMAILLSEVVSAKGVFKRYPVKSGMILYDINTSGVSPGLTTNTIGVARLVFDDWGAKELKEDDANEVQTGDFNEEIHRHTMSKIDYGTIYTVDFDENVTYQTRDNDMDMAIAQGTDLSNESINILQEMKAVKIGEDNVSGYKCDVWRAKDQLICLYKGIPLKISITTAGFTSTRIAQIISLNEVVSSDQFALPGFAVMLDEGYTTNASAATHTADFIQASEDLGAKMKKMGIDLYDENLTFSKNEEEDIINTLGARYLKKQKRLLPKLMVSLGGAKECLNNAEYEKDASTCLNATNKINEELGDQTSNYKYKNWNKSKKEKIVKSIDKEMDDLNVTIDCVDKYNLTTDVIKCTEGTLEPKE